MQSASRLLSNRLNKACLLCQQNSTDLICQYCMESIHLFDQQQCAGNLMSLPYIKAGLPDCQFSTLRAIGPYRWPMSDLLAGLKFNNQLISAKVIAALFVSKALRTDDLLPDCIVPVPLGPGRYTRRKYNQSIEIARYIGMHLAIPVQDNLIRRVTDTMPQTELSAAQRKHNLHNAFELLQPLLARRIVIFDDVVTTGATTQNLYALINAQYPHLDIEVWAACVTPRR